MPVGRYGPTVDVTRLAVFLCSDVASFIAGQTFVIDGHITALMSLFPDFGLDPSPAAANHIWPIISSPFAPRALDFAAVTNPFKAIPLTQMRKIIASCMTEAKWTIPHFRLSVDIEIDLLIELRKELRQQHPGDNLSLNDLLIKACATALMDAPAINVQWTEEEIRQYASADISVVMAVAGGLSTPVIRRADSKSIWEISREVKELAMRAGKNTLKMNEILGGSFSISNLGMYGIDQFDAIINPPQCATLAVGAAKPRLILTQEHETRIATVMTVTLSCDHRAIDGATGAQFLSALRRRLEQPGYLRPAEGT